MAARIITPLSLKVPIVDQDGNPTPYLNRILEEISAAKITASVLEALGGNPGGDRVLVWDDSTEALTFMTTSEVLDFISGASHGDILYRDSTSWETLNPGTAGQLLQTNGAGADPTWITPASTGAWTVIETLSPSGVASINSEAWAGAGYKAIKFFLPVITMSADDTLMAIRLKLNGSYKTAANYARIVLVTNTSGTAANATSPAGTSILLTSGTATHLIGNAAAESFSGEVTIYEPDNTTRNKKAIFSATYYNPSTVMYFSNGSGGWTGTDATSALTGVQFLTAGGNFSGTIKVLGLS